jgi:hypothetical protein
MTSSITATAHSTYLQLPSYRSHVPETSVKDYHSTLRNIPEDRNSQSSALADIGEALGRKVSSQYFSLKEVNIRFTLFVDVV